VADEFVEAPPHPPRNGAATSPHKRGEVGRGAASLRFRQNFSAAHVDPARTGSSYPV